MRIKNLCTSKDIVKRMERKATGWEKIFINFMSDRGFASRVSKELSKFNYKKDHILKMIK